MAVSPPDHEEISNVKLCWFMLIIKVRNNVSDASLFRNNANTPQVVLMQMQTSVTEIIITNFMCISKWREACCFECILMSIGV